MTEKEESLSARCSVNGVKVYSSDSAGFMTKEQEYIPDINDRVRVNSALVEKAGVLQLM